MTMIKKKKEKFLNVFSEEKITKRCFYNHDVGFEADEKKLEFFIYISKYEQILNKSSSNNKVKKKPQSKC